MCLVSRTTASSRSTATPVMPASCTLARNRFRFKVGQRVRRDGSEEMWHSVLIHCDEAEDGSLAVRVIVCHFDWDESRQIALIQSKPNHNETTGTLTFD